MLSYLAVGIYWSNHHHMLYVTRRISGGIMWADLHLLFWLSLVPFVTRWMGDSHFAPGPTMLYGVIQLLAGLAYWLLENTGINGRNAPRLTSDGVFISSTMMVMMIAKTPSLNASIRPFPIAAPRGYLSLPL